MSKFTRKPASKVPKRRFLIVCEGVRSEPEYIRGAQKESRNSVIEIDLIAPAGATKILVEKAVEKKKAAAKRFRRSGDPFDQYDEVWCAFDVDSHPLLAEALNQAQDNDIRVALSNPCFEVWIILHHRDHRKEVSRDSLQSECKHAYSAKDKHIAFDQLWPNFETAKDRARKLRRWQLENERAGGNPWTNFDELVDRLCGVDEESDEAPKVIAPDAESEVGGPHLTEKCSE